MTVYLPLLQETGFLQEIIWKFERTSQALGRTESIICVSYIFAAELKR